MLAPCSSKVVGNQNSAAALLHVPGVNSLLVLSHSQSPSLYLSWPIWWPVQGHVPMQGVVSQTSGSPHCHRSEARTLLRHPCGHEALSSKPRATKTSTSTSYRIISHRRCLHCTRRWRRLWRLFGAQAALFQVQRSENERQEYSVCRFAPPRLTCTAELQGPSLGLYHAESRRYIHQGSGATKVNIKANSWYQPSHAKAHSSASAVADRNSFRRLWALLPGTQRIDFLFGSQESNESTLLSLGSALKRNVKLCWPLSVSRQGHPKKVRIYVFSPPQAAGNYSPSANRMLRHHRVSESKMADCWASQAFASASPTRGTP